MAGGAGAGVVTVVVVVSVVVVGVVAVGVVAVVSVVVGVVEVTLGFGVTRPRRVFGAGAVGRSRRAGAPPSWRWRSGVRDGRPVGRAATS